MNTRKEKIEFLNGLLTGERKLNELRPSKNFMFNQDEKNPDLFKESSTGETVTGAQLDELERQNPNSLFIIFIPPNGTPRPGGTHIDFNLAS